MCMFNMNLIQIIYFSPLNNLHKIRVNEIVNFWQTNDKTIKTNKHWRRNSSNKFFNWEISALVKKKKKKKSVTDFPPLYLKGAKVDSIKKRVIYLIEIFKKQLVVMFCNFSQGLCLIPNTNI